MSAKNKELRSKLSSLLLTMRTTAIIFSSNLEKFTSAKNFWALTFSWEEVPVISEVSMKLTTLN